MQNNKRIFIFTLVAFFLAASSIKAQSTTPGDGTPSPSEGDIILVPQHHDDNTQKDRWHRSPAYTPLLLSIDGHTLYSHVNAKRLPVCVEIQNEAKAIIAQYTFSGRKAEQMILPETWNGRFFVRVTWNERIYTGEFELFQQQ